MGLRWIKMYNKFRDTHFEQIVSNFVVRFRFPNHKFTPIYLTWTVLARFQRSDQQALEEVYQLFFQPCVQQEKKLSIVVPKSIQAHY